MKTGPTSPTSACVPLSSVVTNETHPLSTNQTASMGASGAMRVSRISGPFAVQTESFNVLDPAAGSSSGRDRNWSAHQICVRALFGDDHARIAA
jgi:hypothetical protein